MGSLVVAAVLALMFASSAAAASFDARGSVEQVYVTGLPADAWRRAVPSSTPRTRWSRPGTPTSSAGPSSATSRRATTGPSRHDEETSPTLTVTQDPTRRHVGGAVEASTLRPDDQPIRRVRVHDDPRRNQARLLGPSADGCHELAAGCRSALAEQYALLRRSDPSAINRRPTLVEYSGYGYARPDGPVSGIAALANLMGFTVVDVNMRGTGCSGGAFDFFEPLQSLDGYDVVETVAHQPWVAHNKVGMLGISYGGISQLFTGADPAAGPRRDQRRCR